MPWNQPCTQRRGLHGREVQRILMELLNQMDGFDQTVNVKVSCMLGFSASGTSQ